MTFRVPPQCQVSVGLVILDKYTPVEFTSTLVNFFTHSVVYAHIFHLIGYSNFHCILKMSKEFGTGKREFLIGYSEYN